MLSSLRRAIAVGLALAVTVLTAGRVEVRWTGKGGGAPGDAPEGSAIARVVGPGEGETVEDAGGEPVARSLRR